MVRSDYIQSGDEIGVLARISAPDELMNASKLHMLYEVAECGSVNTASETRDTRKRHIMSERKEVYCCKQIQGVK